MRNVREQQWAQVSRTHALFIKATLLSVYPLFLCGSELGGQGPVSLHVLL